MWASNALNASVDSSWHAEDDCAPYGAAGIVEWHVAPGDETQATRFLVALMADLSADA